MTARSPEKPIMIGSIQMDEKAAVAALHGSRELLAELAQMFIEDAPTVCNELEAAAKRGDTETARRAAHSLKGMALTFYAEQTSALAKRMEDAAASGRLKVILDGGHDELCQSVDSLIHEFRERQLVK